MSTFISICIQTLPQDLELIFMGCRLERKGMERKRMEWNERNVMEWKGRVNGK